MGFEIHERNESFLNIDITDTNTEDNAQSDFVFVPLTLIGQGSLFFFFLGGAAFENHKSTILKSTHAIAKVFCPGRRS